jgi:hypothetical protein
MTEKAPSFFLDSRGHPSVLSGRDGELSPHYTYLYTLYYNSNMASRDLPCGLGREAKAKK